jgi:hypothetical protein
MKDLRLKISAVAFLLFIQYSLIINPIFAACGPNQTETDVGCITNNNPVGFAVDIYTIGLGVIGTAALISILIGAYQILTSQGDPTKLQNGKSYIVYAIMGLVLAIGGFAFYRIIAANVLQIPGFQ